MEASKKRKRDIDYPRITYDVADRTFDRLFKEESLDEMKQVVRKKMGYSSDIPLHLAQLRDSKTVDLEDDDDFDAFSAATYAVPVIVVRVTVGKPTIAPVTTQERSGASQTDVVASAAQTDEDNNEPTSRVQKSAKKRKISRNDASSVKKKAISKDTVPINGSEATCEPGATTDSAQDKSVEQASAGGEKKRKRKKDSAEAEPPQEKSKKKKAKAADHDATASGAASKSAGPPKATTSELPQDVQAASNVTKPEKLKKSKNKSKTSSAVVEVSGDEAERVDHRPVNPLPLAEKLAEAISQTGDKNKNLPIPSEEPPAKKKRGKNEKEVKPINRNKSTLEPSSQSIAASETNNTTEGETSSGTGKSKSSSRETETSLGNKDAMATLQKIIASRRTTTPAVASKTSAQEPTAPKETENAVVKGKTSRPPGIKATEIQPNGVESPTRKRSSGTQSCPICKESPLHLRFQCPVVVRGVEALETRLAELQEDTSVDQSQLIGELKMMIERKRKTAKMPKTKVISDDSTSLSGSSKVAAVAKPPQAGKKISILKDLPVPGALSALGSVSYTDLDLEAIIRGPRVSLTAANIPSTDTSEDEEERDEGKAGGLLEDEEVVVKVKHSRKRLSSGSSDEDEEEEEESNKSVDTPRQTISPPVVNATASEPRRSSPSESSDNGDRSFMDVDGQGESVEIDKTGDAAFSEALADDTAVLKVAIDKRPPESQASKRHQTDDDSDTAVASQKNEGDSAVPVPIETAGNARNDSIEPAESPKSPEAPHSPIMGSSQIPPLQSTPKLSQSMRTRTRQLLAKSGAPSPMTKAMKLLGNIHEGNGPSPQGNEDSVARRTRTATRSLTQLPIPVLTPRVIKPPMASQPHPQAQEEEEEEGESPAAVPNPPQSSMLPGKTPAKPSSKTSATTKARAKTPAKVPPKTALKGSKLASKASARGRGKTNDVNQEEANTFDADTNGEDSDVPEQASLNTWEVLNDNSSVVGDITMMMEDELQSSPSTQTPFPKFANGQSTRESERDPASQDKGPSTTKEPLFILTESQPGFPYSQWAMGHGPESANDSEDEEEVAAVVKPQLARQMASHSFRRLTDITASQQLFQAPIKMQPSQLSSSKDTSNDPYGRKGKESESEESDTESDSDEDTPTHIPKERRAGRVK